MTLREEGSRKGNGAGKFRWGAHPRRLSCHPSHLLGRLADDGPSRRGSARGKRRAHLLGRLKDPHTQKHMPVGKGPACGSSCTDTSRQEARLNQAGDNPEGAKAQLEGVPNTSTPSSGREKRQKSGSRPVGPRARARKKTKRRGSGGAPTPPSGISRRTRTASIRGARRASRRFRTCSGL